MLNIVRDEMICRKQNTGPWSVFVKTDERGTREKIPNRLGNCFFKGCMMNIFTPRGRVSGELYWFRLVLDVGKFFMTAK